MNSGGDLGECRETAGLAAEETDGPSHKTGGGREHQLMKYEVASGQGWDGGMMVTDGGNGSNDLLRYTHGKENVGGIGSTQDGLRGDWAPIAQNDGLQGKD